MGVRGRNQDVGWRNPRLALDSPAHAAGGLVADGDDIVGNQQQRRSTVAQIERRAQQLIVDAGADPRDVRIAEKEMWPVRRDISRSGAGNKA